jgi:phosphoglycerol transferase MdoB-like AlkP superfamily enzyme
MSMTFDLLIAGVITLVLGTALMSLLGSESPSFWADLISIVVSIAAGLAVLARRRRATIIPVAAVFIPVLFALLALVHFAIAARHGRIDF